MIYVVGPSPRTPLPTRLWPFGPRHINIVGWGVRGEGNGRDTYKSVFPDSAVYGVVIYKFIYMAGLGFKG